VRADVRSGTPALPVDTHVYRVSKRLGLIPPRMSADDAHAYLEARVPPEAIYAFHVGLIRLGRYICLARNPRCVACVMNDICPQRFCRRTAPAHGVKGLGRAGPGCNVQPAPRRGDRLSKRRSGARGRILRSQASSSSSLDERSGDG